MSYTCIECGRVYADNDEYCPYDLTALVRSDELPLDYYPPEPCEHEWREVFEYQCSECVLCGAIDC